MHPHTPDSHGGHTYVQAVYRKELKSVVEKPAANANAAPQTGKASAHSGKSQRQGHMPLDAHRTLYVGYTPHPACVRLPTSPLKKRHPPASAPPGAARRVMARHGAAHAAGGLPHATACAAGAEAFCVPRMRASVTKDMPPTMLLAPRMAAWYARKAVTGITLTSTVSRPPRHW